MLGGQQTAQSRALAAGRLVSRSGARLTTAALPRCLSSRRCMRSWRVRGWPLSRPEAARPPPPSSLPSMVEWPGGTRAFPRWRERSRCTCAHETPPLGGTVRVSRPRPVSWQPLSRPKLTVLRARQPPPCTPWLSCRFTKPRRSNRCTRVVPTRGWRSWRTATDFALRATKVTRAVPREGDVHHGGPGAPSLAQPGRDEGRRQGTLSRRPISQGGLFGTVEGFAQQFSAVQQQAPSTRQTYALKWSLFATWCSSRREDPRRCTIGVVLSFLQERLERRLSPSTLKVYVVAIAAHHDAVDGRSLGKHDLIVRFLKGARRMNPSRPPLVPSWDLSIVLAGLQRGPFEPLDSVELKFLTLKTALLTALTSIKRVGDLQAFSVSEECLVFGPVYSHVVLRPRPGYVPKVPTTPFRDQVVNLQALPSEEADPALALLCPVRALRIYVTRTGASEAPSTSLSAMEDSRKGRLSPNRGWPTG